MKILILVVMCLIMYSCMGYIPVEPVTPDEYKKAMRMLTDSGYTNVNIIGKCPQKSCFECSGVGFAAMKGAVVVVGCIKGIQHGCDHNPRIVLE